jgi:hypothetical protein
MQSRQGAKIGTCCRDEETRATAGDKALYNCNTCAIFISEWADADELLSIYEAIDQDDGFELPDYGGKPMAVQDCWRANDKPKLHDAIRSLARKMNVEVVELEENRENSKFCGEALMMPMPPHYPKYAPKRFGGKQPDGVFTEQSPEKRIEAMRAHADGIPTDDVICNCTGCTAGIDAGGKHSIHILELVFDTDK